MDTATSPRAEADRRPHRANGQWPVTADGERWSAPGGSGPAGPADQGGALQQATGLVSLRGARLVPALISLVGLAVTAGLATMTEADADRSTREAFERQAEKDTQRVQREIDRYRDGAAALRSYLMSTPSFDPDGFESFVSTLDTPRRYRGVESALWVTRVAPDDLDAFLAEQRGWFPAFDLRPPGPREEYRVLTYAAPLAVNGSAVGFDIGTNLPAVEAQNRARDTGRGAATMAVPLAHASGEKGFVVLSPVYQGSLEPTSVESRRAALRGWVATPVRANVLLNDIFPPDTPCSIEMFVGSLDAGSLVATLDSPRAPIGQGPVHLARIEALGQQWFLRITGPAPAGGLAASTILVLLVGLATTGVLVLIAHSLIQRSGRKALQASDSLLRSVTGSLHEGLIVVREGGDVVVAANRSAPAILGLPTAAPVAAMTAIFDDALFIDGSEAVSLADLVRRHGSGHAGEEGTDRGVLTTTYGRDGEQRWVRVMVTPIEGSERHLVVTLTAVTDQMKAENRLRYQAQHDALTGLANRARFLGRLSQLLSSPSDRPAAVVYIDLDRLKWVNDTCGHVVGDQLLRIVAQRIRSAALPGHLAARLGGDEFALVGQVSDEEEILRNADHVLVAIGGPVTVGPNTLEVSASAGVALRHPASTVENILAEADVAMYRSKELGGRRATLFDDELRRANRELQDRIDALRHGLRDEDVYCQFQPLLDLPTGRVRAVEALVRWRNSQRVFSPMEFLPIVERIGIAHRITELVFRRATQYQQDIGERSGIDLVWVNLSANDLASPAIIERILQALSAMGASPWQFGVEVTEHQRIHDLRLAATALNQLRSAGLSVALDDFGTGHSYIQLLSELPVDAIKLDKSLVQALPRSRERAIASALVDMAHSLELTVTAEGVETAEQLLAVEAIGCDRAQGFLIDRKHAVPHPLRNGHGTDGARESVVPIATAGSGG